MQIKVRIFLGCCGNPRLDDVKGPASGDDPQSECCISAAFAFDVRLIVQALDYYLVEDRDNLIPESYAIVHLGIARRDRSRSAPE